MKTILIAALLLGAISHAAKAQTVDCSPAKHDADILRISHADFGNWLTIGFYGNKGDAWHPNWTSIETAYKPVVRKLTYGKWEITFTDEFTERLP